MFCRVAVSGSLPDPLKAQENLKKFVKIILEDVRIRSQLLKLVSPDCECKKAEEAVVSTITCCCTLSIHTTKLLLHS